jgi:hypothetical protein
MALRHSSQNNNVVKKEYEVLLPRKIGSRNGYFTLQLSITSARQNVNNCCHFNNKTSQQDSFLLFTFRPQVILKNTIMNIDRRLKTQLAFLIKRINSRGF